MTYAPPARKVAPAEPPPRLIPRHRLVAKLRDASDSPLMLVSAGPGSGKTVLLGEWMAAQTMPAAWISLESADNEPERFWTLVGIALHSAGILAAADTLSGLPHSASDTSEFVAALAEAVPGPSTHTLVLDDAHVLSHPTLMAELDAIVRYGFPRWRLLLSARADPMLPLHRYRLAGLMTEIRADELAMTRPEARALLRAHGVSLRPPDLELLTRRTEGWVAGLRLSAMSMSGARRPEKVVTQLAVDQGSVGEYLLEEVLERQTPDVRRLLLQTSFLDEVTGELAVAITGIPNSAQLLDDLARTNSFVLRNSRAPEWFRYHHLFGEILRYLAEREYGKDRQEYCARAATWYEQRGDSSSALRFSVQARDWVRVSSVMVHGGFARSFIDGQSVLDLGLGGLLDLDDDPLMPSATGAEVKVAQAAVAAVSGQLGLAQRNLQLARSVSPLSLDTEATAKLVEVVTAQQNGKLASLEQATEMLLHDSGVTDSVRGAPGMSSALRLFRATRLFWEFGAAAALEPELYQDLQESRRLGLPHLELDVLALLQLVHTTAGRTTRAHECETASLSLIGSHPDLRRTAVHHLASAHGAYLRGDLPLASRLLLRGERASSESSASIRAAIALRRGWVLPAAGRAADAHQLLLSVPELALTLPAALVNARAQLLAEIETRMGRPNAALRIIAESGADRQDAALALAAAQAHLELGDHRSAEAALRPVIVSSDHAAPLPVFIEILLTSARVRERAGTEARAVEDVMQATELTNDGILQPFVDARASLQKLLQRHPEASAAWPSGGEAQLADTAEILTMRVPLLAEPLTDRETAVLRRLATTMTTAEIGNELCVSINTVKTHIAAIYRKLPAAGRRDAVARARHLELL